MVAKEMIGLLLAGGQGSRLGILTSSTAKPAVPYGGKYRIIDFPLSNCVNSGIDTVGVFTQYQPLELNAHIGIGKPWDLDRINGGVTILSPFTSEENNDWFKGTANAVFQNIHYIDKINPQYVVILSGDHIYKMDYAKMLDDHKKNKADGTISVFEVPWEDAHRFGIMNTDEKRKIVEFEEKPQEPKNNLASMGVYIFTWSVLREYLIRDNQNPDSDYDFGKNVIPMMLEEGRAMYAYPFAGYWKDVGTIDAYWESNMDLIKLVPEFDLFDRSWKIYTNNPGMPAHYIGGSGSVKTSIVGEGCQIFGVVRNSIIFPNVTIGEGAYIENSIIMQGCVIERNVKVWKSILAAGVTVGEGTEIGVGEDVPNKLKPNLYYTGITVVGESAAVPSGKKIGKNVAIHHGAEGTDFPTDEIASGETIFKGGIAHE